VLAGGKSSRMGRDKALLELAGRPLIERAVSTLRQVCSDVFILSGLAALGQFAPLVRDAHPECGPLGGVEAALLHSSGDWVLIVPVDVPFLTADFLKAWVTDIGAYDRARVALFTVDGVPQPTVCLLHREVLPYVQRALEAQKYRLLPVLQEAGRELAVRMGVEVEAVFVNRVVEDSAMFANLNTPEDLAAVEGT